ncbi:MAG: hypothetical protein EXR69_01565 [Myxococcales bacterium]|nr:hypothetical protein [Myxococcales bacterium]
MARTGGRAALWAWALLAAGSLAQWLTFIEVPGWRCAGLLVAAVIASSSTLALEVAVVAGPAAALAELRLDGSWLGLRSTGARGRDLLAPVTCWAFGLGIAALLSGHLLVPAGRVWLREAQIEAAAGLRLEDGRATVIGPWALASGPDDGQWPAGLRFAGGAGPDMVVGQAATVQLTRVRGAVRLDLGPGEVHQDPAPGAAPEWSVRFTSLETSLAIGDGARVQVGERSTPDLLSRPLDAYETWILWKRSLVPMAAALLAGVGLPLGGQVRAGAGVGVLGVLFWALLRLADAAAQAGSPLDAAVVLLAPCGVATAAAWATWRDR